MASLPIRIAAHVEYDKMPPDSGCYVPDCKGACGLPYKGPDSKP